MLYQLSYTPANQSQRAAGPIGRQPGSTAIS